jgi:membrane-bound metal-dependent hydrolase YbcI (DUF457 family)
MSPIAQSGVALLGWQVIATRKNIKSLGLFLLIANLPDIDFILRLIFGPKRISIHQYFTHNLLFVVATSALLSLFLPRSRDRWGLLLVGLSHLVLDIFVIDLIRPIGIRPFFPFSRVLFNFGFFPYLERGRFHAVISMRNLWVLGLEAAVFVLPVLILFGKKILRDVKSRAFWTA